MKSRVLFRAVFPLLDADNVALYSHDAYRVCGLDVINDKIAAISFDVT